MKYDIKLNLDKEFEKNPTEYTGTKIASGYVEVNAAFKFPVSILKKKNEPEMFVKYPDVPNGAGGYDNVVFPVDAEMRENLNLLIIDALKAELMKGYDNPEIDQVRVTVLQDHIKVGKISIAGYASIMISGFAINGIAIKEGANGFFVQMPQTKDASGKFHDIVYGTNVMMQNQIKEAVLNKYKEEMEQLVKDKDKVLYEKLNESNPFMEVERTP